MVGSQWDKLRRYVLWSGVPGIVAGIAAWAAFADDKDGWTVVAAAVAAIVGAFGPTVTDRVTTAQERRRQQQLATRGVEAAELPASVAWLLHPQKAVVAFVGRGWVLRELETWAADPETSAVRLVIGAGGVGKTRLAHEFAARMSGWDNRWIRVQAEEEVAGLIESGAIQRRQLLIVDYAETRDRNGLAALLCAAQQASGVRLLLLARTAGLWWETLSAAFPQQAHLVDALTVLGNVIELPVRVEERSPQEILSEAMSAFAAYLGRQIPAEVELPEADEQTPLLRLHAEALVAVLGGEHRSGRYDVLAEVLGHEARYWRGAARKAGLVAGDVLAADAELQQVVGTAALLGAGNAKQTARIIRRVPLSENAEPSRVNAYVGWLSGLYPTDGDNGGLGSVQPDLLAEALAVQVLRGYSAEQRAAVFGGLAAAQAVHALTVLGRACVHQPDATMMIDAALAADPLGMAEAVVQVGVQFPGLFTHQLVAQLADAEIDLSRAQKIAASVPHPSLELGPLALALTRRIVNGITAQTRMEEAARWTSWYGLRLAESGKPLGALMVIKAATDLYRDLVAAEGDAFLPALAMSLNNHATRLAEAGRWREALTASQEAVGMYRALAATNQELHLPDLAMSLSNHASRLRGAGRRDDALTVSQEAVKYRRELAARNRDAYLSALAASLHNHAVHLATAGQRDAALTISQEAVELRRELAAANPDTYLPDLAMLLSDHAARLAAAGRRDEALRHSLESVDLYKALVARLADAYAPDLAASLSNLTIDLVEAGRRQEALITAKQAVDLHRRLVVRNPDLYRPGLAGSLNNYANQLGDAGRRVEALTLSREAVELRRDLAASNQGAYLPDLAAVLHNHAARLADIGRRDEALRISQEAVDLRRELVTGSRDAHLPDLAMSLNNHALRLAENGKAAEALRSFYDFHRDAGSGPMVNPFPLVRGRRGRANAHHNGWSRRTRHQTSLASERAIGPARAVPGHRATNGPKAPATATRHPSAGPPRPADIATKITLRYQDRLSSIGIGRTGARNPPPETRLLSLPWVGRIVRSGLCGRGPSVVRLCDWRAS